MDLSNNKGKNGAFLAVKSCASVIKRSISQAYKALSSTQRIAALLYFTLLTSVFTGVISILFVMLVAYMFHRKLKGSDAGEYNEVFMLHLRQCYLLPLIFTTIAFSFAVINVTLHHSNTIPETYLSILNLIAWGFYAINFIYYHLLLVVNLYRLNQHRNPIISYFSPIKVLLCAPKSLFSTARNRNKQGETKL